MATFEIGCPYQIFAPGQLNYISFNNLADAQFAGYITDVTGLDDSEIRESADVVPSGHGGRNHKFYKGRRPWTISGLIMPVTPAAARAATTDRIEGIMGLCLQQDGSLAWQPSDGISRFVNFRQQQPTRITKGQGQVDRRFQISGVVEDWRVLSGSMRDISASGVAPVLTNAVNIGTADAAPLFTITGPASNISIINNTTSKRFVFLSSLSVAAGHSLQVVLNQRYPQVYYDNLGNYNGYVDISQTDWTIAVSPQRYSGINNISLQATGTSPSTTLRLQYFDSWA